MQYKLNIKATFFWGVCVYHKLLNNHKWTRNEQKLDKKTMRDSVVAFSYRKTIRSSTH